MPASTPTVLVVAGSGSIVSSTRIDTYQRPALSRDMVTVDGSAPSGSGRDQRISSGSAIFARVSCPVRQRNPERVYSADCREFLRDLKRGYLARLAKNAAYAPCRCRNACCSGTEDTSLRKARSSDFFHSVSA